MFLKDPPAVTFRAQGAKNAEDCKPIEVEQKNKLDAYMKQFDFND